MSTQDWVRLPNRRQVMKDFSLNLALTTATFFSLFLFMWQKNVNKSDYSLLSNTFGEHNVIDHRNYAINCN